jgi:hypothetical protein
MSIVGQVRFCGGPGQRRLEPRTEKIFGLEHRTQPKNLVGTRIWHPSKTRIWNADLDPANENLELRYLRLGTCLLIVVCLFLDQGCLVVVCGDIG